MEEIRLAGAIGAHDAVDFGRKRLCDGLVLVALEAIDDHFLNMHDELWLIFWLIIFSKANNDPCEKWINLPKILDLNDLIALSNVKASFKEPNEILSRLGEFIFKFDIILSNGE